MKTSPLNCIAALALAALLVLAAGAAGAIAPTLISYQGQLAVDGQPFTGQADFKFAILCNTSVWSNDGSSVNGSEPTAAVTLPVENGVFSVLLGDQDLGMDSLSSGSLDYPCSENAQLRVWVNTGNGFEQLADQRLASSPYALVADQARFSTQGFYTFESNIIAYDGRIVGTDTNGYIERVWMDGDTGVMHCDTLEFEDGTRMSTAPGPGGADGDWIVNGNDMYAGVSGNVGIGTSAPLAKLHLSAPAEAPEIRLNGDGAMVAGSSWGAMTLHRNGITLGRNRWRGSADGNPDYSLEVTSQPNALVIDGSSGVLGMGTPTPSVSKTLTLQGVGAGSGWLQFRTSAGVDAWHMTNEAGGLNFIESGVATNRLFLMPGGNVGIGTNAPGARLDVAGNTIVRGDLTVQGSIIGSGGGAAGFYAVPPSAFLEADGNLMDVHRSSVLLHGRTANQGLTFEAPVHLPHGATITQFRVYLTDSDATRNIQTFLLRDPLGTVGTPQIVATLATTGAPGSTTLTSGALSHVVDNENNSYVVACNWTTPTTVTACAVNGMRVSYTAP